MAVLAAAPIPATAKPITLIRPPEGGVFPFRPERSAVLTYKGFRATFLKSEIYSLPSLAVRRGRGRAFKRLPLSGLSFVGLQIFCELRQREAARLPRRSGCVGYRGRGSLGLQESQDTSPAQPCSNSAPYRPHISTDKGRKRHNDRPVERLIVRGRQGVETRIAASCGDKVNFFGHMAEKCERCECHRSTPKVAYTHA